MARVLPGCSAVLHSIFNKKKWRVITKNMHLISYISLLNKILCLWFSFYSYIIVCTYDFMCTHTVKKEKKIFLLYKEIQKGSSAKSYMTNGFFIYD